MNTKQFLRNIVIIFSFSFFNLSIYSQSFTVQFQYDTLDIDDILQVNFIIKNLDGKFSPPIFEDFTVASGPNSSSQFSMINGVVDQSKTYSYLLIPNKAGSVSIPSASLTNNDLEYKTEPASIFVYNRREKNQNTKNKISSMNEKSIQLSKPTKKRVLKKI